MEKDYTVTERFPKKIFACICILVSVLLIYVELSDGEISTDDLPLYGVIMLLMIVLLMLCGVLLYSSMRPRVKVYGERIVCYPRLKRKFEIRADDITARIVEPMTDYGLRPFRHYTIPTGVKIRGSRVIYNPLRAAIDKGSENSSSAKLDEIRLGAATKIIRYRINDSDIISVHNGMKNALKFDEMIVSYLNKKKNTDE